MTVLYANVNYAQVTTINALGRTATTLKTRQQPKLVQNITAVDNSAQKADIGKNETHLALPLNFLTVTSSFGERFHPIYHKEQLHGGVDFKAFFEPVYAFAGGVVTQAGYNTKSGNYINVLHGINGTLTSTYAHLSYLLVKAGDKIQAGHIIGISGNTGSSTAPHLHFALKVDNRPIDPIPVLTLLIQLLTVADQGDNTEKGAKDVQGK